MLRNFKWFFKMIHLNVTNIRHKNPASINMYIVWIQCELFREIRVTSESNLSEKQKKLNPGPFNCSIHIIINLVLSHLNVMTHVDPHFMNIYICTWRISRFSYIERCDRITKYVVFMFYFIQSPNSAINGKYFCYVIRVATPLPFVRHMKAK